MDEKWFEEKNQWLHNCNLETAAFISGDGVKRGPFLLEKLLFESQRGVYPLAAALNLKDLACNNVIVGDRLTSETIKSLRVIRRITQLRLHVDEKILFSMKINGIIICILLKISLDSVVKASFQNLKRRIYLWIDLWEQLVSIAMV